MDRTSRLAERYERAHPGTGVGEAQAAERQERIDFKAETAAGVRSTRNRGIVVPDLPWHKERRK